MVSCVFPGSFDPVTKGHLDLISRAAFVFDHVTVALMINISKKGAIPTEKRLELLRTACRPFGNVTVESWQGLLADYMREKKEKIVIRGIRGGNELDLELQSAAAGRLLNDRYEVIFLPSDPAYKGISSSAVREIAAFGGDIRAFVPEQVAEEITVLLSNRNQ